MPVIVNEPISLLQRVLSQANPVRQMAEDLEYCSLLSQAALASDPLDRLLLVAAFAVSSYASSQTRATRKPFNPLLGETYELTRPDLGFRFVAEKVSHHPTIIAGHANGDRFTYAQENCVKSKFWGKSVELRPHGLVHVVLKTTGEHFVWSKVTTRISGMLERTISHVGDMTVRCIHPCPSTETGAAPEYPSISATAPGNVLKDGSSAAGLSVTLSFKDSGYFSASPCTRVTTTDISFTPDASTSSENDPGNGSKRPNSAVLYSSSSSKPHSPIVKTLEGTWTHELAIGENVVWRYNKPLLDEDSAFGFGAFAVSLNELCYDILPLLPRTDSRLRGDQRLYECGHIDEAGTCLKYSWCALSQTRRRCGSSRNSGTPSRRAISSSSSSMARIMVVICGRDGLSGNPWWIRSSKGKL